MAVQENYTTVPVKGFLRGQIIYLLRMLPYRDTWREKLSTLFEAVRLIGGIRSPEDRAAVQPGGGADPWVKRAWQCFCRTCPKYVASGGQGAMEPLW